MAESPTQIALHASFASAVSAIASRRLWFAENVRL